MATTKTSEFDDGERIQVDIPDSGSKTVDQHEEKMHSSDGGQGNAEGVAVHEELPHSNTQSSNTTTSDGTQSSGGENAELVRAINQLIQINMEQTGQLADIARSMSDGITITL